MTSKLVRLASRAKLVATSSLRTYASLSTQRPIRLVNTNLSNTLLATVPRFTTIINMKYSTQQDTKNLTKQQIEEKVLDLVRQFDRVKENPSKPDVKLESHLIKDLGLDSLDHVEIIVQLEDTFGYEIPDSDYEKLLTPNEIVNYLQKRLVEV